MWSLYRSVDTDVKYESKMNVNSEGKKKLDLRKKKSELSETVGTDNPLLHPPGI